MSLGGGGPALGGQTCATTTDGQRAAICAATSAGISVVVAAGNENANLMSSSPALYPEVLTVTAMGDADGRLGERGAGGRAGGRAGGPRPPFPSSFVCSVQSVVRSARGAAVPC
jgi:hypothetical protein